MADSTERSSRGAVAALTLLIGALGLMAAFLIFFPPPTSRPGLPEVEQGSGAAIPLLLLPIAGVLAVMVGGFLIPFLLRRREEGRLDASSALLAAGALRSRIPVALILRILRPLLLAVGSLLVAAALVTTLPVLIDSLTTPSALPEPPREAFNLAPIVSIVIVTLLVLFLGAGVVALVRRRLATQPKLIDAESLPSVESLVDDPLRATPFADLSHPAELSPELAALFQGDETAQQVPRGPRRPSRLLALLLTPFRLLLTLLGAICVADYYLLRAIVRLPLRLVRRRERATTIEEPRTVPPDLLAVSAATLRPAGADAQSAIFPELPAMDAPDRPANQEETTDSPPAIELNPPALRPSPAALALSTLLTPTYPEPSLDTLATDLGALLLADLSASSAPLPDPDPFVELAVEAPHLPSLDAATHATDAMQRGPLRDPFADLPAVAIVASVEPPLPSPPRGDPFADLAPLSAADTLDHTRALPVVAELAADLPPVLVDLSYHPLVETTMRAPLTAEGPLAAPRDEAVEPLGVTPSTPLVPTPQHQPPADPDAPVTIFVVALAPQSGKSTVAAEAARLLETTWINSSAVIAERVERRLSLPYGYVAETRAADHDAFRPELIAEGDRMSAEGTSPGVECVRRGYRVIDGIRRREELEAAIAEVRSGGGHPIVLCVRRPNAPALADNTESAALEALADAVLVNDGSLDHLRALTAAALPPRPAA